MALTTGAFLSDSGNPSNGNGSDGDHYRDTANQNLWFKASGSWALVGNLNDNTPDGIGTIWAHHTAALFICLIGNRFSHCRKFYWAVYRALHCRLSRAASE